MHYRLDPSRNFANSSPTAIATRPMGRKVETGKLKAEGRKNSAFSFQPSAFSSPSEGSAPLSNAQKASIAILAKDAWIAVGPDEDLETWRHQETAKAVGVESLRVASQRDYRKILAHFQRLAGETERAAHSEIRAETGPLRTAWHILRKELAARGLAEGYAGAIAKCKFKCALGDCSPKQLWVLIFDVRTSKKPLIQKAGKQGGNPL